MFAQTTLWQLLIPYLLGVASGAIVIVPLAPRVSPRLSHENARLRAGLSHAVTQVVAAPVRAGRRWAALALAVVAALSIAPAVQAQQQTAAAGDARDDNALAYCRNIANSVPTPASPARRLRSPPWRGNRLAHRRPRGQARRVSGLAAAPRGLPEEGRRGPHLRDLADASGRGCRPDLGDAGRGRRRHPRQAQSALRQRHPQRNGAGARRDPHQHHGGHQPSRPGQAEGRS